MKPLFVVAVLDGRLGHEKQTRGVVDALANLTPVDVIWQTITGPAWFLRMKSLAAYLVSFLLPAVGSRGTVMPRPDLIIGTGSATHLHMLLLKKSYPAQTTETMRLVTCMTPDLPLVPLFDLCLVPRHDQRPPADNIFETMGPPSTAVNLGTHDDRKGLILVGGIDPASHVWNAEDVLSKIHRICEQEPERYWTISSSPRTPEETIGLLRDFVVSHENMAFYKADETEDGWIERQYQENEVAWVTADSVSMVYEALSGGCLVGIIPVRWKRPNNKFQVSLDQLIAEKLVLPYDDWLRGGAMIRKDLLPDEAGRCAREILQRWWPERISAPDTDQQADDMARKHP